MILRRSFAAAAAALPLAFGVAVFASRPRAFRVDLDAAELDAQLFDRNDA